MILRATTKHSFIQFMEAVISQLDALGKERTAETYKTTLANFRRFLAAKTKKRLSDTDISLIEITSDLMLAYEAHLKANGICSNTTSFYIRIIRATYNRAIENGLIAKSNPFKHVYTGVDKTSKRALALKDVRRLKQLKISDNEQEALARDLFLFSLYTRGMSFVDMAFLQKNNLNGNILTYRRRKTGQMLNIKWEPCMQSIVARHSQKNSQFLLPILSSTDKRSLRTQYLNMSHRTNRYLKKIGASLNLPIPLTMYVARHSWANIARTKNIPLAIISEGLGHDSESTTRIYLASLDTAIIDRANASILRCFNSLH